MAPREAATVEAWVRAEAGAVEGPLRLGDSGANADLIPTACQIDLCRDRPREAPLGRGAAVAAGAEEVEVIIAAARAGHTRRVLVPDHHDAADTTTTTNAV